MLNSLQQVRSLACGFSLRDEERKFDFPSWKQSSQGAPAFRSNRQMCARRKSLQGSGRIFPSGLYRIGCTVFLLLFMEN